MQSDERLKGVIVLVGADIEIDVTSIALTLLLL